MAYFHTPRLTSPTTQRVGSVLEPSEWRCTDCGKLLGVRHGARLHIRLQRHNYLVSLPVEATCYGCGTPNRT